MCTRAAYPRAEGSRELARLLGKPEPGVATRLWRLARQGLLRALPDGLYAMDPAVREAALTLAV
jgi:DNA-binding IclR family transcriptional regulator